MCIRDRNISVEFPLGRLVSVTGVSGSGKSTLINELLHPALCHSLGLKVPFPQGVKELKGIKSIDKVIVIDQSPIGRTPRSNPATYTGAFDPIRQIFTATVEAKARGYQAGQFSFNVKGGRCEAVSYTHLRAHETSQDLVCRLLLEKKKTALMAD